MSKTYQRIEINGKEESLPKETGYYFVAFKDSAALSGEFFNLQHTKHKGWGSCSEFWLNRIDWYLQPIADKAPIEEQKQFHTQNYLCETIEPQKQEEGKATDEIKGIVTVENRIDEILGSNPYSIHPDRIEGYQTRESVRFLAKQIDILHKLRIKSNSKNKI